MWTCRAGADLQKAIDFCRNELCLEFDAINENIQEAIDKYKNDCRKVGADEYWDDRALTPIDVRKLNLCKTILKYYPHKDQMFMAVEEMAELQKAVSKAYRGKPDLNNIAEEIADVEIMLEQLKQIFGCRETVNNYIQCKLNRTLVRTLKT